MSGELETVVQQMFKALDDGNAEGMKETFADDIMGLDEVSRTWFTGREQLAGHIDNLISSVADISSDLQDIKTTTWDGTAVVACRLEQDYTYNGVRHHISAPTTLVLRRQGDAWKIAHFHSAPLPE
jgi:uncharacterized protein (TIGR02246 family)